MDTNILLENGTNELEVLEFTLGKNHYGINVAKIREILSYQPVTPIPNANPSVEGIFMPRDVMITVINLKHCLGLSDSTVTDEGLLIITNFNKLNIAFHVDEVIGIHRVSWADIITPDSTVSSQDSGIATGVVKIDNQLIIILDFEKIVSDISPETGLKVSDIEEYEGRERSQAHVISVEDSPLLGAMIGNSLKKSGYVNLTRFANGQEAWDYLQEVKSGAVPNDIACIITDIEMPQMDGHHLTKLIKTDEQLKNIPVIIFSSLINEQMRAKGELLGADAQLSKPEIGQLVGEIDKLINAQK